MTREQAQQLAANPVWQGFREGKQVEYRCLSGEWRIIDNIGAFDIVTEPDRYRLKPEPRRFWINSYGEHDRALHDSREEANKYARQLERRECIEVVEVLPQPAGQPPAEQPQPAPKAIRRWAVLDDSGSFLTSCSSLEDARLWGTGNQLIVELTGTYTPKGGSQ